MTKHESPELVAVGHLCMDTVLVVDRFPEENTACRTLSQSLHAGGSASQSAVAFARLGGRAGYLGLLGNDYQGHFLLEGLRKEGVDSSHLKLVPGAQSPASYVVTSRRNASRTLLSGHGRLPDMDFDKEVLDYLSKARVLHLDGTHHGNAQAAAEAARQAGLKVSLDGCSLRGKTQDQLLELLRLADILIMNEAFPQAVMNRASREEALMELGQMGKDVVISTSGSQGCLAVVNGQLQAFPAYPVQAVDTTGAGDAFHGAFLYAWLRGCALVAAIQFASATAALNCLGIGGRESLPSLREVLNFLAQHEEKWRLGHFHI